MPRGGKEYTTYPTTEDRIVCVMHLKKGEMTDFTVQYDALIKQNWTEITRIDTCHGSAHRHKFTATGKEIIEEFFCNDYNEGFTEAKKFITENFHHLRNNYLTAASRKRI